MLTEKETAAWEAFSVALQERLEAHFGRNDQTLALWMDIRDMPEITHMLKAAKDAGRAGRPRSIAYSEGGAGGAS